MRLSLYLPILLLMACRSSPPTPATGDERPLVGIVDASGEKHEVRVEIADTDATRARGLMHRKELGENEGMLFVFQHESIQSFWMRNTLIPLDMLFIDSEGLIAGIVVNAEPLSETPRTVGLPSRYVLEVNGGWSVRRGIQAGDRVDLSKALGR